MSNVLRNNAPLPNALAKAFASEGGIVRPPRPDRRLREGGAAAMTFRSRSNYVSAAQKVSASARRPDETGFPSDNGLRIRQWETFRHYSANGAPMFRLRLRGTAMRSPSYPQE